MEQFQIDRREQQRAELERREGERRRNVLDVALMQSPWNRREADRRAEIARRKADRLDAARFNFQLMRWHNARERNAA